MFLNVLHRIWLNRYNYFNSVQLTSNGYGIEWKNGQDIAPHELYDMSIEIKIDKKQKLDRLTVNAPLPIMAVWVIVTVFNRATGEGAAS